jgi:hypothetical protein
MIMSCFSCKVMCDHMHVDLAREDERGKNVMRRRPWML